MISLAMSAAAMAAVASAESPADLRRDVAEQLLLSALRAQGNAEDAEAGRLREALLADVSRELAGSLDESATLDAIARTALPSLGAWCIVDIQHDDGTMRRSAIVHDNQSKHAQLGVLHGRWSPESDDRLGLAAVRTHRQPVAVAQDFAEVFGGGVHDAETLAVILAVGIGPVLTVPLVSRGQLLGAVTFVRDEPGSYYTRSDIALAQDLMARGAMALDNARLYGTALALAAKAEASSRSRDRVLGVVAHDLRAPLHVIAISAALLGHPALSAEERAEQITTIQQTTKRASRLIADLLDVTRIEAGELALRRRSVNVADLIRQVDADVALLGADAGHEVVCRIDDGLPPIDADPDRVLQIFSNLCGNAIKFSSTGSRIHVFARQHGEFVEFAVSDAGPGISADKLTHVFDGFWNGASDRGVAGLGLSIVKALVQAHGGSLSIESALARGTTFRFTMPVVSGDPPLDGR